MSVLRAAFFTYHINGSVIPRYSLQKCFLQGKSQNLLGTAKRELSKIIQRCAKENVDKPKLLSYIQKFGFGGLGVTVACILKSRNQIVFCKEVKRTSDISLVNPDNSVESLIFEWTKFFKYLYPHIWYLLIALSSALIVALLNIQIPQCVGSVINVLTEICQNKQDSAKQVILQLTQPAFTLARMYIVQAFFTFVYIYTLSHVGERVAMSLRQDLFKSIIMQDIAFFDKTRSGEIVSRLTSDIQDFKSSFKICISQGLRSFTQIIGCIVSVIVISPQLTTLVVLSLPPIIFVGTLLGRSLRMLSMEAQNQVAKSTAVCEEAIQNIRTVRAFAAEEKEAEMFYKEIEHSSDLYERLGFGISFFQAGTNLLLNGILLSTLYFGGQLLSTGQLSPGNLMAFLMATQTIQKSLGQLSVLFGTFVRGQSAGARVFQYLDMPPSSMMIGGDIIADKSLAGNIVFKDVNFSYPTRPDHVILKNFNLHIPAGKTVAIVGTSGNGKSTVAVLLERYYDVDKGSITIDGRDIRSLNSSYLRGNVLGYINQEPTLFATSIMENIRYGKQDATDEEVIEAAKEANAHEFIIKFPDSYATEVGERGTQLSGGQKQRVAIARALLKQPSVLILDEATSALDYESERVVQKAIENVTRDRTVLVIAHRLSTIKGADVIVVLQRGVIVEMGTHSELIKRKGVYYTLVNEQEKENM
ncbi:PREDICTED: ATP-binding cassette sub-family B member 8, mitochondrial-like [Cyphomyrmex costatus]|uniref:Mitochondrial potassium channel ATP-binding subunit n=1 Tax=Cyphomyrmex costatus TaxID=456900 RepID=A0A151IBW7_9HYME|nr:PREDICTED: ATP-binding cassette sub-family B member 8, mitochondrial-like [Cyphomyrmex costatus]KYM97232.1 ATP-binding cassette sub-family B member 8, mitochondrial [Cyphomyrmex costatus]